ncbi:MAG: DUF790 family protein [Deltaproteobacteria bacterium]|nr:DUF790 family protein [Deltaproteobacteria bacterium]
MLTAELLDFIRRKGTVRPRLADPDAAHLLELAEALIALVESQQGQPRGELEDALRAAAPPGKKHQPGWGLAHLLRERCEFETVAAANPREFRAAVFDAAALAWRTQGGGALNRWRPEVLAQAAQAQGLDRQDAEAALYADLAENQRLTGFRKISPRQLIHRYNTAQIQGHLLRAESLEITAPWPSPPRLRQWVRYLRFYGLLYSLHSEPGTQTLRLVVEGPDRILAGATRYGLALAAFFPALLLWEPPWVLTATVVGRARRSGERELLRVEPHPWLRSHYPDSGQWVPEDVRTFMEAFAAKNSPWRIAPAETVFTAPGNRCLVPDFVFHHALGGEPVHLEYLPQPSTALVSNRLALVAQGGFTRYLLASREVPGLKDLLISPSIPPATLLTFRRSLVPAAVLSQLESYLPR